ncbi:SEC-C metal-binding domain-containing protein [Nocardia sp. alder85J]|uniref:SEC-C metal-binding domain-containing protein n=1 Tax=Nocardia sp. alder85J TaxID=2862949 RepID=UPI001CD36D20|nr:SEC-C metal-binding domain-containing protein [Nocardia sp. alder85J]MCX4093795.1 SEC-C metal-binding domain-containing protein [Nocardia sp. alder85J]MCX4099330.1 SEC-C metal-binding domain-containing protein [Nocardia sp. alder85J]
MTTRPATLAAELEADLDRYPDQRGEILLEAAVQWWHAADHDRAIELLRQGIDLGGEDAGNARVTLAEILFDLDRDADANAQLDALRQDRINSAAPYHMAAELLEERGDLQQALTWFNIATSRLSDDEMAERDTELGFLSYASHVLAGRRRVRRALELPPDDLDDSVASLADRADEFTRTAIPPKPPREMRVLFWPRPEIPSAHQTWPQLVETVDADATIAEREKANRDLAESGVPRITMVPLTVAKLLDYTTRTGSDPTDSDTRLACINEIIAEGHAIGWPPPRNTPCWCGSTTKYKKCCGRPTT